MTFVGRNFTVHGSNYKGVDMWFNGRTWVTFQVQTSKDATVGLFNYTFLGVTDSGHSIYTIHRVYAIVIGAGSNTYACIR